MLRFATLLTALSLSVFSLSGCGDSFAQPAPANMVDRVVGTGSLMVNGVGTSYGIVERGPLSGPLQTYHRFVMPNGTQVDCPPASAETCVVQNLARFRQTGSQPASVALTSESSERGH